MTYSSDEELPDIKLKSPKKRGRKKAFIVPDASVLAARRKEEDEKDSYITKIIERTFSDMSNFSSSDVTADTSSDFSMPDADKIAAARVIEMEKDRIIQEIIHNKTFQYTDPELHSCIDNTIHSDEGLMTIPGENPGVHMSMFNYTILSEFLSTDGVDFIKDFFMDVYNGDNKEKERLISNILHVFFEMYSYEACSSVLENVLCHFFIVCCIILDKECRQILTITSTSQVVCKILNKVPSINSSKSTNMLDTFSRIVIKCFTNHHDRLHLSEHFIIKCKPSELETNSKYFSNTLAKQILYQTLCSIVNYSPSSVQCCNSFYDLRSILHQGKLSHKLLPYEQYILLKICNEIYWMLGATGGDNTKQSKAKTWIINFFTGLKCNTNEQKSADFFKVKSLSSKLKLLWQMDTDD